LFFVIIIAHNGSALTKRRVCRVKPCDTYNLT